MIYSKMREKFTYLFLRPESELADPTHPDWIFKYLSDQWDTIHLRSDDQDAKVLFKTYLSQIQDLILKKYLQLEAEEEESKSDS